MSGKGNGSGVAIIKATGQFVPAKLLKRFFHQSIWQSMLQEEHREIKKPATYWKQRA